MAFNFDRKYCYFMPLRVVVQLVNTIFIHHIEIFWVCIMKFNISTCVHFVCVFLYRSFYLLPIFICFLRCHVHGDCINKALYHCMCVCAVIGRLCLKRKWDSVEFPPGYFSFHMNRICIWKQIQTLRLSVIKWVF